MGEDGFEPSKQEATDLQSAPFGHSGTLPYMQLYGAGGRTRTPDLLITNQLLYQLSYTSGCIVRATCPTTVIIIAQRNGFVKRFFKKISANYGGHNFCRFCAVSGRCEKCIKVGVPGGGNFPFPSSPFPLTFRRKKSIIEIISMVYGLSSSNGRQSDAHPVTGADHRKDD